MCIIVWHNAIWDYPCICTCIIHIFTCRLQSLEAKQHLHTLVQQIKALQNVPINTGKAYDDVQERQKNRKIKVIRDGIKRAVFFCDSFGLDLLSISLKSKAGKSIVINYDDTAHTTTPSSSSEQEESTCNYGAESVVLYLLDKFGISDEFYQELSMVNPYLPRSHLVKRIREKINSTILIFRLPQPYFGSYRPLEKCIVEALAIQVPF